MTNMTQKEKFMLLKQIIKERAQLQRVLKANRKTVHFKGERTTIEFVMYSLKTKTTKKFKFDSAYAAQYLAYGYEHDADGYWFICEHRIPGFSTQYYESTTSLIHDLNYLYAVLRNERKTVRKSEKLKHEWEAEKRSWLIEAYEWFKKDE